MSVASVRNVSYSLSNLVLTVSESGVVPLDEVNSCLKQGFDGLIGLELFSRSVVEIDYRASLINIHEPRGYNYSGRGTIVPLEMTENGLIFVRGAIKPPNRPPIAGRILIDTGLADYSMVLYSPFVESNNLLTTSEQKARRPFAASAVKRKRSRASWSTSKSAA